MSNKKDITLFEIEEGLFVVDTSGPTPNGDALKAQVDAIFRDVNERFDPSKIRRVNQVLPDAKKRLDALREVNRIQSYQEQGLAPPDPNIDFLRETLKELELALLSTDYKNQVRELAADAFYIQCALPIPENSSQARMHLVFANSLAVLAGLEALMPGFFDKISNLLGGEYESFHQFLDTMGWKND